MASNTDDCLIEFYSFNDFLENFDKYQKPLEERMPKLLEKIKDSKSDGQISIAQIFDTLSIRRPFHNLFDLTSISVVREILKRFNLMFLPFGNPYNMSLNDKISIVEYFDIEKEAHIKELKEYALDSYFDPHQNPNMMETAYIAQNFYKLLHVFNELYFFTDKYFFLIPPQIEFLENLISKTKLTKAMKEFLDKCLTSVTETPLSKNYIEEDFCILKKINDKQVRKEIDVILTELALNGNVDFKFMEHYRNRSIITSFTSTYNDNIFNFHNKSKITPSSSFKLITLPKQTYENVFQILSSISIITYPNMMDIDNLINAQKDLDNLFSKVADYRSKHTTKETFDNFKEECRTLLTKYKLYNPKEIIFHDEDEAVFYNDYKIPAPFFYGTNIVNFFRYPYLFDFAPMKEQKVLTNYDIDELNSAYFSSFRELYIKDFAYFDDYDANLSFAENIAYRIFVDCYLNQDLTNEADKAFAKLYDHFIEFSFRANIKDKIFVFMSRLIAIYAYLKRETIEDKILELILTTPECLYFSELIIYAAIKGEIDFDKNTLNNCFYQIIISKYVTHHYYEFYTMNQFSVFQNPILFKLFNSNKAIKEVLWENVDEIHKEFNELSTFIPQIPINEVNTFKSPNYFIDNYEFRNSPLVSEYYQHDNGSLLEQYLKNFIAPSLHLINSEEIVNNKKLPYLNERFSLIGKYLERYTNAINELIHNTYTSPNGDTLNDIVEIVQNNEQNSPKAQEIREYHLKNSPISFKDLKDHWKFEVKSKFNNFKITSDIATLFNFYAIPNNQVEDPSYMPASSFGGFIFLEKPLYIPDFLFEKIKAYRYALEAALELKTINYLKEIFLYKVVPLIKKKKPGKKMAQEIEIFAKLNNIDFKAQCKEYRNEINNITNLDAVPARKELKDDYEFFIYFNLLKYIDSINLIKTKFKTKLQFSAKEAVVYLGKEEILDLKDYVQIILKYDPLKKNETQNERVKDLYSKINQSFKNVVYFNKNGLEKTRKLRDQYGIINIFEPNEEEIIIPSLVAKKNLNFKDIDEKIKETKEVHDILIPIFTDKNEITPIVPVISAPVKEKTKAKTTKTKTKAKTKTTKKDELASTQDNEALEALEDSSNSSNSPLNKLSKDLQAIIKKISSLDEFTFEEFEKICKEHKIMANGAIDTINSWAYEEFDAPLIEIDTPMFFDKELLEEI